MVSAGTDGTVKIWNFSNGSSLKNLVMKDPKHVVVDKEITCLTCVYDAVNESLEDPPDDVKIDNRKDDGKYKKDKPSYFVASGWDRRVRVWFDDRACEDENVTVQKDLPYVNTNSNNNPDFHQDDIMSTIYDYHTN